MAVTGSCLCGGVRFEIDRAEGAFEICHCNRCRKTSGARGMAAIAVRRSAYRLLAGGELIRTYSAPILYQPPAYTVAFCSQCGSPVPLAAPTSEWLEVPAGLLDDDPGVRPERHIFVELLPAWDAIRDPLPQLTMPELVRLREGRELPAGFPLRTHRPPRET